MPRRIVHLLAIAAVALAIVSATSAGRKDNADSSHNDDGVAATFHPLTLRIVGLDAPDRDAAPADRVRSLLARGVRQTGQEAISTFHRVLDLELPESPESEEILAEVHYRLGRLYENAPEKQLRHYTKALELCADPGLASRIDRAIRALPEDVSLRDEGSAGSSGEPEDLGPDDSCSGAIVVPWEDIADGSYSEVMNIFPPGDHNWRSFTVPGSDGVSLRLETLSDTPGSFADDTDLTLWDDCPEDGGNLLFFNDDGVGTNAPFMSSITTGCVLPPRDYHLQVGGFADISTPDNFDLEIEAVEFCGLPQPDEYEPDDEREQATSIGHPTSTSGNNPIRFQRDIQHHTIVPTGDRDHVSSKLTRNEFVRMGTAAQFPTPRNGFQGSDPLDNPDTILELLYAEEKDYGGRCNEPDFDFRNVCFSDDDCPDPLPDPVPGFPPCIPLYFFNVPFNIENPLAFNDDRGGGDFGSELLLCLPRTQPGSDSASVNGDWVVRTTPFSSNDIFDYEIQVRNEVRCNFEMEPNNSLTDPNPLPEDGIVHGIFDFSETIPFQDADVFVFDVDEDQLVKIETFGYDVIAVDTALLLIVGPDDNEDFFLVAEDNDGGTGLLSRLELILPPASDLLGNTSADADYLINVTSDALNPNFPYTLTVEFAPTPTVETEPNDTCDIANPVNVGETIAAAIDPTCDFDAFKFSLTEDTFVTVATTGAGDTTVQLEDCDDSSVLACDDDGGPGLLSLIDGCLPTGDYCVRVRAFSGFASFNYGIELEGTAGCVPTDPPTVSGDGLFTCATGFGICP